MVFDKSLYFKNNLKYLTKTSSLVNTVHLLRSSQDLLRECGFNSNSSQVNFVRLWFVALLPHRNVHSGKVYEALWNEENTRRNASGLFYPIVPRTCVGLLKTFSHEILLRKQNLSEIQVINASRCAEQRTCSLAIWQTFKLFHIISLQKQSRMCLRKIVSESSRSEKTVHKSLKNL